MGGSTTNKGPRAVKIKTHAFLPMSELKYKIFSDACASWEIWHARGDIGGQHLILSYDDINTAIRALQIYQVMFNKKSKNRKRVIELIKQIEQARSGGK